MAIVLSISELTDNPYRISKLCHSQNEPIFITKDGYGDMVVMNFDVYQQLKSQAQANISRAKLDFSKPVKIDNDNTDNEKTDDDEANDKKSENDIKLVLQKAKEEGGIEKIPLEDVLGILKNELDRLKDTENRKRFP